jgi:hypothetical protein
MMTHKMIQLFIKLFVLKTDSDFYYEVHTPQDLTPTLLNEIQLFREKIYSIKCPYLLEKHQLEIERKLSLDERSFQVIARKKSNDLMVGSLRLTPYPFELTELSQHLDWSKAEYSKNLEIGRLLTDPTVRNVGKKILILAGIHASEKTNGYNGFIGISRTQNISYFKKYGMSVISKEINLIGRPTKYQVIQADFKTMRKNVLKNFVTRLMALPSLTKERV